MKKFILGFGTGFINFMVVVEFILVWIVSVQEVIKGSYIGFLVFVFGNLGVIVFNYLLYLFIDIKDKLEEISIELKSKK